jgi:hypothetical protein
LSWSIISAPLHAAPRRRQQFVQHHAAGLVRLEVEGLQVDAVPGGADQMHAREQGILAGVEQDHAMARRLRRRLGVGGVAEREQRRLDLAGRFVATGLAAARGLGVVGGLRVDAHRRIGAGAQRQRDQRQGGARRTRRRARPASGWRHFGGSAAGSSRRTRICSSTSSLTLNECAVMPNFFRSMMPLTCRSQSRPGWAQRDGSSRKLTGRVSPRRRQLAADAAAACSTVAEAVGVEADRDGVDARNGRARDAVHPARPLHHRLRPSATTQHRQPPPCARNLAADALERPSAHARRRCTSALPERAPSIFTRRRAGGAGGGAHRAD